MTEREWSTEEIVESLRQWDSDFYSDSETKWLMGKAADAMDDTMSVCVYLLFKIAVLDSIDVDKAEHQNWITKVSKHFSDKQKVELRKNGYCV